MRGGIRPQKQGSDFETRIENICQVYKNQNFAVIDKVPVEKIMVRGRLIYKKKSTVDFIGFDKLTGRYICFDAKSRTNAVNSWTYGNSKRLHKQFHQIEHLYSAWRAGAASFLLLKVKGNRIFKIVPDETWKNKIAVKIIFDEHKQIDNENLENFLVV